MGFSIKRAVMGDQEIDGTGHRARLRERLFEGGPNALLGHEPVEYRLGLALPRRAPNPLPRS
jgi:DNA repair protein RadC